VATTKPVSLPKRLLMFSKKFNPNKLSQPFEREIIFFLVIGFASYFFASLFSFYPYDPTNLSATFPSTPRLNIAGALGANISAHSIYYFGITAYLLPIPFIWGSFDYVLNKEKTFAYSKFFGWLLAIASTMVSLYLYYPKTTLSGIAYSSAGVWGNWIASNIITSLGIAGSTIVVITTSLCALVLIMRQSLLDLVSKQVQLAIQKIRDVFTKSNTRSLYDDEPKVVESTFTPLFTTKPTPVFSKEKIIPTRFFAKKAPTATPRSLPSNDDYHTPSTTIFKTSESYGPLSPTQKKEFEETATLLCKTFEDFGINGQVVAVQPGPVVTVFEFQPNAGTKISKINSLVDDLALALRVDSIMMNPVRGKSAIGIQVPNSQRETVHLGDIIQSEAFQNSESPLTLALGKSLSGDALVADLAKMPHLLTAGATGSGKSVAINALLCSVIMKSSPKQVRMILVDPKMLELSIYEGIPHLLMPVITQAARASLALKWAVNEMERRYKIMQHAKVRNIAGFNEFWRQAKDFEKVTLQEHLPDEHLEELPMILLVIDELADLMLTAPKEIESLIQRLAQKARASGIHLVLATQRPSVDIITGVIKANLPCRSAFQVVSKHDSRTILDQIGADKLLGNGDMLLMQPGKGRPQRIQGAFVSDEEVINLVHEVKLQGQEEYDEDLIDWINQEEMKLSSSDGSSDNTGLFGDDVDPKFDIAVEIAATNRGISASFLQRKLKIGYNRAARIVESMEAQGMVAPAEGSKPREWLGP